jgi:hypothetical protein
VAYNLSDVVSRAEGLDWQQTSLRVSDNFSSAFAQRLKRWREELPFLVQLGLIGGVSWLGQKEE